MARVSAVPSLLGLVLLAVIVVGTMGHEEMGSTLPQVGEMSQMTRKLLQGSEENTEDGPPIEPCSPAYKGKHPRGFLIKSPGKMCSSDATVCTKFDELQCGIIEECKNVTKVDCTEFTTVKTHFGGLATKCANSTTTVETKCKDYKVCTYFACVPKAPGAPDETGPVTAVAFGPTGAPGPAKPTAPGPSSQGP